ncbi:MAG TPA: GNAT family N-acetyltransferase [Rubrobacter sp.]|nr:GNAT family N-acetyltransferase [Rubrobacter sp.]
MRAQLYEQVHLPALSDLVNLHLAAVVPGWALPAPFLAEHLERNPGEFVTDPWVVDRSTLCVTEGHRMLAAAHLLRYGEGPEVAENLRGVGEISWLVFLRDRDDAAAELLSRVQEDLTTWPVTRVHAHAAGLPKMPLPGIPEAWPHVASALAAAGYQPPHRGHREALYGGPLDGAGPPGKLPVTGMTVRLTVGRFGARFSAMLGGEELGRCECLTDLDRGGSLPALRGWAELSEVHVAEGWRNRCIGSWLVGTVAAWLRLGRRDRVVLAVNEDDEAAGAGRFYRRFGWDVLAREMRPWSRGMD